MPDAASSWGTLSSNMPRYASRMSAAPSLSKTFGPLKLLPRLRQWSAPVGRFHQVLYVGPMGETAPFRRTWRVTLLRGVAACVPALGLAALFSLSWPPEVRLRQLVVGFLGIILIPGVWLILGGAWLDHKWSKRGPGLVLVAHLAGSAAAFWLTFIVGGVVEGAMGHETSEPLAVMFFSVVVPILVVIGFLFAWLVPGSFPSRSQRVPSGSRVAQPPTSKLARKEDAHDAH